MDADEPGSGVGKCCIGDLQMTVDANLGPAPAPALLSLQNPAPLARSSINLEHLVVLGLQEVDLYKIIIYTSPANFCRVLSSLTKSCCHHHHHHTTPPSPSPSPSTDIAKLVTCSGTVRRLQYILSPSRSPEAIGPHQICEVYVSAQSYNPNKLVETFGSGWAG